VHSRKAAGAGWIDGGPRPAECQLHKGCGSSKTIQRQNYGSGRMDEFFWSLRKSRLGSRNPLAPFGGMPREKREQKTEDFFMYENSVHPIGFLGADAQTRTIRDGVPLTIFSLATKRFWKDRNGAWQSQTEWHRISCFAAVAEFSSSLRKGARICVSGYLRSRGIDRQAGRGKSNGARARAWEVRAIRIAKLDRAAQEDPSNDIPASDPAS